MKKTLLTFLLLLIVYPVVWGSDKPARIVSINLCTDQLLLLLADPGQITSVSFLALEPTSSYMARQAAQYPVNYAKAEELIDLQPDLILAGAYTDRALILLLRKLGYRVETFPLSSSIDDIRDNIRLMAKLIDRESEGEMLVSEMNRRLEKISRAHPKRKPRGAFYQPNGYTGGRGTLQHSALELAGWKNIADEEGVVGYGAIDLERLIRSQPEQLFTSSYAPGTQSRGQQLLKHPVLRQITQGREPVEIDYKYWICGGPMIADAVEILHRSLPQ
ncbi:ABC transporter substrate-binding protein [Sedimenticola selenatireducens]|uniref:ABC transporter substrate-binding protein n=1 Tax=Sedimenticola selenatireducens TaxID=191960 RepID=A0A557SEH2_9GAMM|nr:ABC transporter substrate-binding protein [Sedimenticola selenatireducens]TVO75825.1 ABC transporter substrate-binding protein [Sedimenticola selenatireducens]TVT63684.1 MAG: ABC transporter substrate-binding protein [Sedimenticola selenatireducens]